MKSEQTRDFLKALESMVAGDPVRLSRIEEREQAHVLAEEVYALRQERKLSQGQLAELMGVAESTVARIERAEATASLPTLRKLAAAFGYKISVILEPVPSSKAKAA